MDIVIPGILRGGTGEAIQGFGRSVGKAGQAVGSFIDTIQQNHDYNSITDITNRSAEEKQKYHQEFWTKEDGSDDTAMSRYKAGMQTIDDKYNTEAGAYNGRVGDYVAREGNLQSTKLSMKAQQTYYTKFIEKSLETDQKATSLLTIKALETGDIVEAIEENSRALESRRLIYGDNVNGIKAAQNSKMVIDYIEGVMADRSKAEGFLKKWDNEPGFKKALSSVVAPDKIADVEKLLANGRKVVDMHSGIDIGTDIFKTKNKGSIEGMTDEVRKMNLFLEVEQAAIHQIKTLTEERNADRANRERNAIESVNKILAPKALENDGRIRETDLTPGQWSMIINGNPAYAQLLMQRMRQDKESGFAQSEEENRIITSPEFSTMNLDDALVKGEINPKQYKNLKAIQNKMDPIKRDSAKAALDKIEHGGAIAAALGIKAKDEEAIWKMKYRELLKTWIYKNANDPNFEKNLNLFVEEHILKRMVTSWFSSDEEDRTLKYEAAKKIAGDMPQIRGTDQGISREDAIKELKRRGKLP